MKSLRRQSRSCTVPIVLSAGCCLSLCCAAAGPVRTENRTTSPAPQTAGQSTATTLPSHDDLPTGGKTRIVQFHYRRKPVRDFGDWIVWGFDRDFPVPDGLPPSRTLAYSNCIQVFPPMPQQKRFSYYNKLFLTMVHDLLGPAVSVRQAIATFGREPFFYPNHSKPRYMAALERPAVRAWLAAEAARIIKRTGAAGVFYDNMAVFASFKVKDIPQYQEEVLALARDIRKAVGPDTPIAFNCLISGINRSLALGLSKVFDYGLNEELWYANRQNDKALTEHIRLFEEALANGCGVWLSHVTRSRSEARTAWLLAKLICPQAYVAIGPPGMEAPVFWDFYEIDLGPAGSLTKKGAVITRSFGKAMIIYDRDKDRVALQPR